MHEHFTGGVNIRFCNSRFTDHAFLAGDGFHPAGSNGQPQQDEKTAREVLTAKTPLGVPWINPDDVAPVVAFLASDEARMISGASFAVTAGDSANINA